MYDCPNGRVSRNRGLTLIPMLNNDIYEIIGSACVNSIIRGISAESSIKWRKLGVRE